MRVRVLVVLVVLAAVVLLLLLGIICGEDIAAIMMEQQ